MAAQWYFALTDTWTLESNALASLVRPKGRSDADWVRVARQVLSARPDVSVAVRPGEADMIRRSLPPALVRRVVDL